jgi:Ubiquitin-2 like Rad60 SUMO-like
VTLVFDGDDLEQDATLASLDLEDGDMLEAK